MLVVEQAEAEPSRPRRRFGRSPGTGADRPPTIGLTRVTLVLSDRPLGENEDADRWLRSAAADSDELAQLLAEAQAALNRTVHAFAVARADPYVQERRADQAEAARIGHGLGEELAEGRFTESLPVDPGGPKRRRRSEAPPEQARVAAMLAGRDRADACETFVLRARADLDAGRRREAAVGLSAAIDAMAVELEGALSDADHRADLDQVRSQREAARAIAARAASGPLPDADASAIADLLAVCERILRRRRTLRG